MKLKEFAIINMGQSPKGETYNTNGYGMPFLQGRKTFGRIYPIIDTWTTNPIKTANKDEILMSVRAPVGDMNFANQEICIGRGLCSINAKNGRNKYLYYMLLNSMNDLKQKSTGTVFDSINRNDLENLEINFHSDDEQAKIENILGNIDSKIELNNEINNSLYKLSNLIYKKWFIDFKFPNFDYSLKKSELGEIPKSWEVGSFDDGKLTKIIKSGVEKYDGLKKYVATADVNGTSISNYENIKYNEKPSRANMTPIKSSVWFAKMENSKKNILVDSYMSDIINNYIFSTGFMGIECLNNSLYYIWNLINDTNFQLKKSSLSTGTLMAGISNSTIKKYKYLIPDQDTLHEFNKIQLDINKKIYNNNIENEELSKLKNVLLPKLMNGEIDLDNIEI